MGRGDVRNMPGNPMMPPPQQNSVGMDDLRRLGRGAARTSSSQGPTSFGPPSMFATRGSNTTRRTLGVLGRGGEDSSASSRTGTPPVQGQRREESTNTTNTFR